jgi:hypothetical protein
MSCVTGPSIGGAHQICAEALNVVGVKFMKMIQTILITVKISLIHAFNLKSKKAYNLAVNMLLT